MYRALVFVVALMMFPSVAAAQQPCSTDANHVVSELYRHMLQRQVDSGSGNWVQQLQSGRSTVREVVRQIASSPEHTQRFWRQEAGEEQPYIRSVNQLYRHILGRQPDAAGARMWADLGARSGQGAVVDQLVNSAEYNAQYGDWGVPGSGGIRYCGATNQGAAAIAIPPAVTARTRRFHAMDTNNDGTVTRGEWRGSPRSFDVHDWNDDGRLSGDELWQGSSRAERTFEDEDFDRDEQFDYLDANGNGRIEPREWHNDIASFQRLDRNRDNRLTPLEFADNTRPGLAPVPTSGNLVIVDGSEEWTDTGLTVRQGETVLIDADGTIQLSGAPNDTATPAGHRTGRRSNNGPLARASAGGLIARIGNSGVVMVGNRPSFTAPASGRLYLGVNDDYVEDNSGEFRVMVNVQRR